MVGRGRRRPRPRRSHADGCGGQGHGGRRGPGRGGGASASDGGELWRESLDEDGSGPFRATSSLVYLETAADSEADKDGEVRFFDTEGEVGSLPVDVDDYSFSSPRSTSADTSYLFDTTRALYDEDLEVVG